MPEQAIRLGAVSRVVSLERIADSINVWAQPEDDPDEITRRDKTR